LKSVDHAVAELEALSKTPKTPALIQHVLCGITGGSFRDETRNQLVQLGFGRSDLIVDVSPAYMLQQGLPYSRSDIGIILDSNLTDVPERYQEARRADRLVSVLADAVPEDGVMIVPAKNWEIQDLVRDAGCRVAIFAADDDVTARDKKVARTCATVEGRRIMIEQFDTVVEGGWLQDQTPVVAQVAAALAAFTLNELEPVAAQRTDESPHPSSHGERAGGR
jgi:cyanophycin synthetase